MKNNRRHFKFIVFLLSLICVSALSDCEIVDKIIVIVNDEVITQRELDRKLNPFYRDYQDRYEKEVFQEKLKEMRIQILQTLINDKLVISEAKRQGVEVPESEVQERLDQMKSRYNSEDEFFLMLEEQGIGVKELEDNLKSSIMAKKLIDREIGRKIVITPKEIYDYYEDNQESFTIPPMVKVRTIFIKVTRDRDPKVAFRLINQILNRAKKGEDFAALAEEFSDGAQAENGGDMGYVSKGDMIKRIDDILFSLKAGQISEIIKTDIGFHIFKVEEIKAPEIMPYDEVSAQIERYIFNTKVRDRLAVYIEELKQNAYIEVK